MRSMRLLRTSISIAAIAAAVIVGALIAPGPSAHAQTKGTTPVGTVTPPPGATTGRSVSTNTPITPNAQPLFLSGRVVLEDGSALPGPVVIERVCGGGPRPEAYTDSKGHFSFQLGQNTYEFADASYGRASSTMDAAGVGAANSVGSIASASSNAGPLANGPNSSMSQFALAGCDLRATLSGYRSDSIPLANRRYMDNPDIGTIVLHRLGNVEGLTTSATTGQAGKDARKAFDKGVEASKKGSADDAQKNLLKAVEIYPRFASAWYELGKVYEMRDHWPEAKKAYEQALTSDPKYASPYEGLYLLAMRDQKWQDVADTSGKLLHLNPYEFPNAYLANALANLQLKNFDACEKSARDGLKQDTAGKVPRLHYLLALALAQKSDFKGAAESMRAYLQAAPNAKDAETAKKQLAEIEKFAQASAAPKPPEK
jgi:tetratricopeptide (TPR) repeat protein